MGTTIKTLTVMTTMASMTMTIYDRCIGHDATGDDDNDGHDDLDVVYEDGCDLNAVRDADQDGDNHGEHDHGDHRRRDHHSVRHSV